MSSLRDPALTLLHLPLLAQGREVRIILGPPEPGASPPGARSRLPPGSPARARPCPGEEASRKAVFTQVPGVRGSPGGGAGGGLSLTEGRLSLKRKGWTGVRTGSLEETAEFKGSNAGEWLLRTKARRATQAHLCSSQASSVASAALFGWDGDQPPVRSC